ncbi:uncharacterized protein E0L32_003370 [Thyridium curvatum]|uniref:Uncharacterized protein n=1 Tax=Thyridium curvatum TaxID=1093900 RepID=A0A507B4R0_9PEZI|nr:uncharacterized protein E0L32_003370 [Thyridium curvatum]TPX17252.1 hypothetical protein E0L32_003370 [Thyridium curvatum]
MAPSRKQALPVESSWRMVEGEHDSFDTSIVPDDEELIMSSNPSQFSGGSQGQLSVPGSQDDDIESFLSKAADDERVIMRSPFQPSVPSSVRHSPRTQKHRSPEPEFYMPRVEVDSPRKASGRSPRMMRMAEAELRQRQGFSNGSPTKRSRRGQGARYSEESASPSFGERLSQSLPNALFEVLAWAFGIVGLAFRYAQKPLAILLAIYLMFGGLIIAQNMATKSLYTSLSPVCRIPGASWLDLPFCPRIPAGGAGAGSGAEGGKKPVEFDGLMDVQERFEEVLEKSANGVSLPMEMKRSEASIRDLRTMVRYSNLQAKEELVLEFDGFIDTARTASNDLQKFNTHVGSAVDSVISINRWTSRYIDGLQHDRDSQGWISEWTAWVFAPFQPATFSERSLLDKYVEHTALVSDKIADLILEAQNVLRTLTTAEDHLGIIYDFVTRTQKSVQSRKDEVLWTLWTLVGANTKHLHNLNSQLSLLRQVDTQRTDAVKQVSELIVELEKIQAGLGDLRDRVAEPEIVRSSGRAQMVPLSVHIETIDRGVERLEHARSRIRAMENDRIRQVLARGQGEERLIEQS